MWISRLRINGGFLNGLDVSFVRGLNVVIGSRGVGKTTLLELLRHALGAEHADKQKRQQREQFLTAVLGVGEVIVDLEDDAGATQVIVDAKGRGRDRDLSHSVLVLGQSELEEIASDAANRLKLIDLRAGQDSVDQPRENLGTLSREMYELRRQLRKSEEESLKRAGLEADRQIYRSQEEALVGDAQGPLASQRDALRDVEARSTAITRTSSNLQSFGELVGQMREAVDSARNTLARLETLHTEFIAEDMSMASNLDAVRLGVEGLQRTIRVLASDVSGHIVNATAEEAKLRETAAPLRETLEQAEAGLGQLTAQVRNIEAQLRELDDNDKRIATLVRELESLNKRRESAFALVEAEEEGLFRARESVAESTSRQIDSHIVVAVEHLADSSELRDVLTEYLKGTHTRAALIDSLSARVLPRMLLEMVESHDIDGLASAGDITQEQSARVIGVLDSAEGVERLAKVQLKDNVDFLLRDGAVDKSVDNLSAGQKCAVTLPIVLSERERTLILDQPEDHLDNAYLVDHVVSAMNQRTADQVQTIVATHNANVPVLGAAGRVFVLASDGQHGQVRDSGAFDTPNVVSSITTIMEGGREAFDRRARFYGQNE
jgi:energy-coupling factor transporter ATP-binding protein EcfA2